MKKVLILILPLLLTGCFGDVSKGYLTNTCTKVNDTVQLKDTTTYEIYFKEDIIENIKITYSYEGDKEILDTLKESYEIQNTNLNKYGKFTFNSNFDNGYQAIYEIEKDNIKTELKDYFNLREERSKQVSLLKELGYTCK